MKTDAIISSCGKFRYALSRVWNEHTPRVGWIMLNPSTADATEDDHTIRRCIGFSQAWGFGGFYVANVYAYRTKSPKELKAAGYLKGEYNTQHLQWTAMSSTLLIAAWGVHARPDDARHTYAVLKNSSLAPIKCLGVSKNGAPKHPLFLAAETQLEDFVCR